MSEVKHTKEDLKRMQALPLSVKIGITQARIMEWYNHYQGKVYVSFSGGKDSTVLLDLARRMYPDIQACFCDTGLEFPEIREFVKTKENVKWLYPIKYNKQAREWQRTSFKEVIKNCGYPVISKEVSRSIQNFRNHPNGCRSQFFDRNSEKIKKYGMKYCLEKWLPLKESNIPISDKCCDHLKKNPAKQFEKEKCTRPIVATMAYESTLRKNAWVKSGCNAFNGKRPLSQPMSFWTEQDVLQYLQQFNIPYCSIYGDIVEENGKLKTTGEQRTGCMFCMYGCHLEKEPNRFQRMKITHPKQYDYCINKLGIGEVLDYIGVPYE